MQNEARALLAAGTGVTVICPRATPDEAEVHDHDGVTVRSYAPPPPTSGILSYFREFVVAWLRTAQLSWRCHRSEGFAVLQACNPPDTYWLLALIWRLWGKGFVYDQHDLCPEVFLDRFGRRSFRDRVLHRLLLWLERASYATADLVVSPNESYREIATGRGRVPLDRTTIVMSTPDHRIMRRSEPKPGARDRFANLVVYVGVMGPQDGVERVLDTARTLRDRGRDDIRFVLLGFGDSEPRLRRLSAQFGLDGHVHFTGRVQQPEVVAWLSAADVGLTPDPPSAFNERSTMNKTLEYMACELPVVATDLLETRRSAGEAAVYVQTVEEMADAVDALLDDPARRGWMGAVGRARIEGELSWDRFAHAYVAAVQRVLSKGARGARGPVGGGAARPIEASRL
ncbi:glycosyltransferase family 4 protein [Aquipuribacter nitratireducens]|uniref:Glycosyltransferase family 4 protein n=1 Tax=Aquipuribacter nitratireducens TaxID=650104 RepID=A0ABW0GQU4_9MICO